MWPALAAVALQAMLQAASPKYGQETPMQPPSTPTPQGMDFSQLVDQNKQQQPRLQFRDPFANPTI